MAKPTAAQKRFCMRATQLKKEDRHANKDI